MADIHFLLKIEHQSVPNSKKIEQLPNSIATENIKSKHGHAYFTPKIPK